MDAMAGSHPQQAQRGRHLDQLRRLQLGELDGPLLVRVGVRVGVGVGVSGQGQGYG